MRRYVKPALRHSANATGKIASQVVVAVTTGLLVALITNTAMIMRDDDGSSEPAGMAAFGDAPGARSGSELPPLEAVVIEDVPVLASEPPAGSPTPAGSTAPIAPAGLYYAERKPLTDPLKLLAQAGT